MLSFFLHAIFFRNVFCCLNLLCQDVYCGIAMHNPPILRRWVYPESAKAFLFHQSTFKSMDHGLKINQREVLKYAKLCK